MKKKILIIVFIIAQTFILFAQNNKINENNYSWITFDNGITYLKSDNLSKLLKNVFIEYKANHSIEITFLDKKKNYHFNNINEFYKNIKIGNYLKEENNKKITNDKTFKNISNFKILNNIINAEIKISIVSSGINHCHIYIYNLLGHVIYKKEILLIDGVNYYSIDLFGQKNGIYIISVFCNKIMLTNKILKTN